MTPPILAAVNIAELGTLLAGVAALLTAVGGAGVYVIKRALARATKSVETKIDANCKNVEWRIDELVAGHIEGLLVNRDPASYYTLDISFENGVEIIVPMIPLVEITVAKNLHLFVADHNSEETLIQIRSSGFTSLPPHRHVNSIERIEIRRGYVTHLESGHVYRTGEVWEIPMGELHSAVFSDHFLAFITHRPALPTAKRRPVNLDGLHATGR